MIVKKTKMGFLVFTWVLYTVGKGFKVPPELVSEADNPRIWVLVIEGHGSKWKGKRSGGGTGDHTECMGEGKDNKVRGMIPMIVHMWHYVVTIGLPPRLVLYTFCSLSLRLPSFSTLSFPPPIMCCTTILIWLMIRYLWLIVCCMWRVCYLWLDTSTLPHH